MRNSLLFIVFCTIAVLTFAQGDRGSRAVPTHEDEIKNTYALIIGISDYENLQSLQFADQDALAMEDFLSGEWGANIPKENIRLLLNNHAKNGDILENGMTWLYDKVKPGDRAIIYFAGHGISVGNNDAYLLSYNTIQEFNTANIFMSGGIPMLQVKRNFIAPMYQNGVQVLLIIDACRSFDIVSNKKDITLLSQSTIDENTGEIRLLSSTHGQASLEDATRWKGHGAFTFNLLRGLYGEADIIEKDGQISFAELKRYLTIRIPEETNFKQEPAFCCDQNQTTILHKLAKTRSLSYFQQTLQQEKDNYFVNSTVNPKKRTVTQLATIPQEIAPLIDSFYLCLEHKNFDIDSGVDYYFSRIEALDSTYKEVKREVLLDYMGALSNEVQDAIVQYMKGDEQAALTNLVGNIDINKSDDIIPYIPRSKLVYMYGGGTWNKYFENRAALAKRLVDLREEYFPGHPLNPTLEMRYYFIKGRSLYGVNNNEAKDFILKAISIDTTQAYLYHVASLLSNGEEALALNAQSLKLYPDFLYALNLKGSLLRDRQDFLESEKSYQRAIQLDSNFTNAYNGLGNLYKDLKNYKEAATCYLKAISTDSSYIAAYYNLGMLYHVENRLSEAIDVLRTAYEKDKLHNKAGNREVLLYKIRQFYNNSEEGYQKIIEIDPGNMDSYFDLGNLYKSQKRYKEAEDTYKKVLTIDPQNVLVYNKLEDLYYDQKQYKEAGLAFEKSLNLEGIDKNTKTVNQTYALIIGISNYENISQQQSAAKDALAFEEFIISKSGAGISKDHVRMFINEKATKKNILDQGVTWLKSVAKSGDRIFLYFAGHGVTVGDNNSYLLAYDTAEDFTKNTVFSSGGLSIFQLKYNFIAPLEQEGVETVLIIDAGASYEQLKDKEAITPFSPLTLSDYTGELQILSSVDATASPENLIKNGYGAFTYNLLNGLYGKADNNQDGSISFVELRQYLSIHLRETSNFEQRPVFCCNQDAYTILHVLSKNKKPSKFMKEQDN